MPGFFLPAILFSTLLVLSSCMQRPRVDLEGIDAGIHVERFDRDLFEMRQDSMSAEIDALYRGYGDFFDVYNMQVIRIGMASSRRYPSYLSMFLNDPLNQEVYAYTRQRFADLSGIEEMLDGAFRHYLYHYPDSVPPRVIAFVSRFNEGLFTVSSFVGIGLDQYLGADSPYYKELGIPEYMLVKKEPYRIPYDVVLAWASSIYPFEDPRDNLLARMIWHGKLSFFTSMMFPEAEDRELMAFSEDQMRWCRNNEDQMWTFLVEEKLLFSNDPMDIRKLIDDAPYTGFYTRESPGRAAIWQGWKIVEAYARRNPRVSLDAIMRMEAQELLRQSRYDP